MVIWLIGLAGSGKTTIGRALYERMKAENPATVFLDGDHVREIMGNDLGHSIGDRRRNGERICNLCGVLDAQRIDVVACVLSLFHDQQAQNRRDLSDYFEVYIDVPMDILEARDQKGLYSSVRAGRVRDVAGMDIPFAPPPHADLVIENGAPCTDFRAKADAILAALARRKGAGA